MSPPVETWPADELPARVTGDMHGKRRKGGEIELGNCEMLEILQYSCPVVRSGEGEAIVLCTPIARLFRKCQDRKGSFFVETTAWEGERK